MQLCQLLHCQGASETVSSTVTMFHMGVLTYCGSLLGVNVNQQCQHAALYGPISILVATQHAVYSFLIDVIIL